MTDDDNILGVLLDGTPVVYKERRKTRDVHVTITENPPGSPYPWRAECYSFTGEGTTWVQAFEDMVFLMARAEEDGKVLR